MHDIEINAAQKEIDGQRYWNLRAPLQHCELVVNSEIFLLEFLEAKEECVTFPHDVSRYFS